MIPASRTFPILFFKNFILSAIKKYKILFISAETGSGKTIFIPQILYKSGFFNKIMISQTRRIAAISSAKYLSKIFNCKIGNRIGYAVRFDELFSSKTAIKFVTDGILFREISCFSFFSSYSCIIVDEFHERTIYTDLILTILKKAILIKKKIRIIIMSASGNSKKIANFFGREICKLSIPGNLYNVSIYFSHSFHTNFLFATILSILKIHFSQKIPGDLLVFLPGYEEIEEVYSHLFFILKKNNDCVFLKKLHSNLSIEEQNSIFITTPIGFRKIILSTNIAESSITIPGIVYVIDSGLSKQKILNWKTGIDLFRIFPISKSEARQRTGRAGRQIDGKCFRLFTFLHFKTFSRYPKPQIKKTELTGLILILSTFENKNLFNLEFISLPSRWAVIRSLELLFILGALDRKLTLTFFGKCMSFFPIDTKFAKSIIESLKFGEKKIISWVVSASSMYSSNFFIKKKVWYNKFIKISKNQGDFFFFAKTLLKFQIKKKRKKDKRWCIENNIDEYFIKNALDIKKQILILCSIITPHFCDFATYSRKQYNFFAKFKFCFTSGFFLNSARKIANTMKYRGIISGLILNIHPSTSISLKFSKTLLFVELFLTSKVYIRGIMSIRMIWLLTFGDKLYK